MAREVHEREDLLRDAVALTSRVQLKINSATAWEPVFAGFRPPGALSLYFDTEPVYHFNSRSQLRRGYVDGRLIKAEDGRLVAMKRLQTENSSELLRHDLTDSEQTMFCVELSRRIFGLKQALLEKRFQIVGQVPEQEGPEQTDCVDRLFNWLDGYQKVTIADKPGVS